MDRVQGVAVGGADRKGCRYFQRATLVARRFLLLEEEERLVSLPSDFNARSLIK